MRIVATAVYQIAAISLLSGMVLGQALGEGNAAVLAAYAALWTPEVSGVMLQDPKTTHMDPSAPQLLNVLRVCDIPETLGLLAPRPLHIRGGSAELVEKVVGIYRVAGAADQLARD